MTLAAFLSVVLIHLAAAISPGPSFVVSIRTAASEGFGTAAALALGFGFGALLWATGALAGLALLFEVMPALFTGLKLAGGLFLLWIALQMWRHATEPLTMPEAGSAPRSAGQAIRMGFLTFAANPKPAVFFGAVFVGLVPPETSLAWKAAILAAVFCNEVGWYLICAFLFSRPGPRAAYLRLKTTADRLFGGFLGLLGLKIALT